MRGDPPRTHRLAVGAYIFHREKLLLLKRSTPPKAWAPPGGKLEPDEDPTAGIRREVLEETGLQIQILGAGHVWFGSFDGVNPPFLGIDYVAETDTSAVTLTPEHTEFVWASQDDIESRRIQTLTIEGYGYAPQYVLDSFRLHGLLKTRHDRG